MILLAMHGQDMNSASSSVWQRRFASLLIDHACRFTTGKWMLTDTMIFAAIAVRAAFFLHGATLLWK